MVNIRSSWKQILSIVVILVILIISTSAANAQSSYSFELPEEIVHYTINDDGTASIEYFFTFRNLPNGHPIDFVDVGLPNGDFDMSSISAEVDGIPVNISSDYQGSGTGVAVELGSRQITDTGMVHVRVGKIERVIYPDDEKSDYVSTEFAPTYFSSDFARGKTNLTMVFHFPAGVMPEESIYHIPSGAWEWAAEPAMVSTNNGITYTWHTSDAIPSRQYQFGMSFPAKYVPDSAIVRVSFADKIIDFIAGLFIFGVALAIFGSFFLIPIFAVISARKRKLEYMKPAISVDGQGIKRGLTAVEAAILLGQPLDQIITMILFSVTKKGALEVLSTNPLKIKKLEVDSTVLRDYELAFIEALVADKRKRNAMMQVLFVDLVKDTTEKMKGFNKKDTIAYYKQIIEKAWAQVVDAKTPEIGPELNEEQFEWTMADKEFDKRSRRVFTQPVFVPRWYGNFYPTSTSSTSVGNAPIGGSPSMSGGGKVQLPGSDFAASVVGGVENFAGQIVGNVNDFTGKITNQTNPVPVSTKSYSSGGGGSCACACACAGCACACAGGGR